MKKRKFESGEIVCLLRPGSQGGFDVVIFQRDLLDGSPDNFRDFCEVLDPQTGALLAVAKRRVVPADE